MTTAFQRAKQELWGLPVPAGRNHGPATWSRKVYGCPCPTCLPSREVTWKSDEGRTRSYTSAERQKRSRENLRGRPVPLGTKHGLYVRRFYGCKCPICSDAVRLRNHRAKNPWMYRRTHGHWSMDGKSDIIWWPRKDQTSADCTLPNCLHIDHKEAS